MGRVSGGAEKGLKHSRQLLVLKNFEEDLKEN